MEGNLKLSNQAFGRAQAANPENASAWTGQAGFHSMTTTPCATVGLAQGVLTYKLLTLHKLVHIYAISIERTGYRVQ